MEKEEQFYILKYNLINNKIIINYIYFQIIISIYLYIDLMEQKRMYHDIKYNNLI